MLMVDPPQLTNNGTLCEKCGKTIVLGAWPWCPHETAHIGVIPDDIPGGVEIKHGLCWPDGTPRKFYSKSDIKKAAFNEGYFQGDDTPKTNQRRQDEKGAALEHKLARQRGR